MIRIALCLSLVLGVAACSAAGDGPSPEFQERLKEHKNRGR